MEEQAFKDQMKDNKPLHEEKQSLRNNAETLSPADLDNSRKEDDQYRTVYKMFIWLLAIFLGILVAYSIFRLYNVEVDVIGTSMIFIQGAITTVIGFLIASRRPK